MAGKIPISIIILTRNEEPRIAECLRSVAWAEERIVIDNGSEDKTKDIARSAGALIVDTHERDFSKLRDIGAKKAKNEWIFYLDADETITETLKKEIIDILASFTPDSPVGYYVSRKNTYLQSVIWPVSDRMMRFFRKRNLLGWQGKLHETALVDGPVGQLVNPLKHNTHRTLEEMVAKTNIWSETEADLRIASHHPPIVWWRLFRVMVTGFWNSYVIQKGWKAGTAGLIESIYQAFSMFITYAKVWEKQNREADKPPESI